MSAPIRWRSRGIGLDAPPERTGLTRAVCFACGTTLREPGANWYMHNIAARIAKADEANALACFERGAWMGYYHADREYPQIKVTACTAHLPELERLSSQWFITPELVAEVARHGVDRVQWQLEHPPEDRTEQSWLITARVAAQKVRLPNKYELTTEAAEEIAATIRWDLAVAGLLP